MVHPVKNIPVIKMISIAIAGNRTVDSAPAIPNPIENKTEIAGNTPRMQMNESINL